MTGEAGVVWPGGLSWAAASRALCKRSVSDFALRNQSVLHIRWNRQPNPSKTDCRMRSRSRAEGYCGSWPHRTPRPAYIVRADPMAHRQINKNRWCRPEAQPHSPGCESPLPHPVQRRNWCSACFHGLIQPTQGRVLKEHFQSPHPKWVVSVVKGLQR